VFSLLQVDETFCRCEPVVFSFYEEDLTSLVKII